MKVLMVCLGNICRSPLAEGILREKVRDLGLNWTIDSAGTGSWHAGELPDPRSIAVAGKNGIDIRDQRARQFRPQDLETFDLIFAMDSQNYRDIIRLAPRPELQEKVHLILDMVHPGQQRSVPDPYWDDNGFDSVYEMLQEACDKIVERWR
jgi:protein-tyrosine phosphatase